ncbi:ABC transporter permease [Telluribacter sp.]|jgi:putative ABC transport system permease protein|uniref:ABC transporter permease n=1 Tax=Telluribacter sp. TaxID=1978767 RepID=UPI002E148C28|nr:ABC transporter permease [Telluribacter sp.]
MNPKVPTPAPPRWAQRLLAWLHPDDTLEEVEGDLQELYTYWYGRAGKRQAALRYLLNVLSVLPPFVRRRKREKDYYQPYLLHPDMIRNYLKIAWRNLRKYPATTAVHLLGLTVGLTTCLLIGLFLRSEWLYDRYQPQGERTYRVNLIDRHENETEYSGITPYPMGEALRTDFPDWPVVVSMHTEGDAFVAISPEKLLPEKRALFVEPQFLDLFTVEMVTGNARQALGQPNQAILSESTAKRYFGTTDVVGRTFHLGQKTQLQVAGIMRDMPGQTNLPANLLVSYKTLKEYFDLGVDQWGMRSQGSIFIRLPENQAPDKYRARMQQLVNKYMKPDGTETREIVLQPLHAIHFDVQAEGTDFVPAVSPTYLWTFGLIGLFVLLIACVNFINLSTAHAMIRAKEVGIRKSIGATRHQLMGQFIGEAGWLAGGAALLSLGLMQVVLPRLEDFLERELDFRWVEVAGMVAALAVLTALAAGLYPALFLSRFKPIKALSSRVQSASSGQVWLRQGLVVFQFTVSLVLAVGVAIIYQQMNLFREKDLGFQREAVLTVDVTSKAAKRPAFRDALLQIQGVEAVSFAFGAPTSNNNFNTKLIPNPAIPEQWVDANIKIADAGYQKTFGLKLLAGRFLEPQDTLTNASGMPSSDRKYVFVVNEAVVRAMGYSQPAQAIGKQIQIGLNDIKAEIVGVVANFHVSSLHEAIKPAVIMNFPYFYETAHLKLRPTSYPSTLAAVEGVWKQFHTNTLYNSRFVEDSLQELYVEEARQFTLLRIFAGLALVICCLGLWGLSTFLIERRTKEIGVRKVLGASITSIVALLSTDFVRLVLIAFVIASPIAWYVMNQWLETFVYQIDIEWWVFALAGTLAVGIALLTVSFQSIKAALMNPVRSLRSE